MPVAKLSRKPAKLTMPLRTRVKVTPEIDARAARWLEQPFEPEDMTEEREALHRDIDAILAGKTGGCACLAV